MKHLFVTTIVIFLSVQNITAQIANHIVISEVYGGGGNSGSTWKNDFIELYNPTSSVVSLSGWSVQHASAAGSNWQVTTLSGSIMPHGFYLVQEVQGNGGTTNLPTPDATGNIALAGTAGKVSLCNTITALSGTSPSGNSIIDFVGFGATANDSEGGAPAPAPSNTTSIERKASSASTAVLLSGTGFEVNKGNGYDTDNNANDFVAQTVINPQNSSSPAEPTLSGEDVTPPLVISIKVLTSTQIEILFNEPVDSLSSSTTTNYTLTKNIAVIKAQRDTLNLKRTVLNVSFMANDYYTLTIQSVKDTSGNAMAPALFQFTVGVLTISQARAAGAGVNVRVCGIITVANEFASPSFMQDSTGGIAVYGSKFSSSARLGDIWEVTGTLKNFNGLLEIDPITDTVRISTNNSLPLPKLLKSTALNESIEGQLIRVNKVKLNAMGTFGITDSTYSAGDSYGIMSIRIDKDCNILNSLIPTDSVNVVGVLSDYKGAYQLQPRSINDIGIIDPPPEQKWSNIFAVRGLPDSSVVKVRGVVTYAQPSKSTAKTIFLQDFSAGICVYDQKTDTLQLGDSVEVKGVLKQYSGLLELQPVDSVKLLGRGLPLPTPKVITLAQVSETYESQLVKIYGVRFSETGNFDVGTSSGVTKNVSDGSATLNVRISAGSSLADTPIPIGLLDIVGVLGQFTNYQIIPRTSADLILYPGPQITSTPAITSLTDSSFTINWSTFFNGNSIVYYGPTRNLGDSVVNTAQTTSHSATVSRLKSGRIYYYKVFSADSLGTAESFIAAQVTTSSASSGQMNVYFNYSVDASLGITPLANGNADLLSKLLERISNTKNTIDLAVYSFDDFGGGIPWVANRIADSLITAHNRGVKVRVVFDNKSSSPMSRLEADGINVMKRSVPGIDGGIMHNKFFVFDGRDTTSATDDWVITGSWNVTNMGTFEDAQNAIFIQDQSLARIYTLEFEEMFGSSNLTANASQAKFGLMKSDNTPHFTIIGCKKVEIYFSPSDRTTSQIIRALSTAEHNIFFGLLAFTRDDIREQLIARKNNNVIVRGLIDQQPSQLSTLQSSGVDVLQAGHSIVVGYFHHKYAAIDPFNDASDPQVITGSHNWSTAAETDNDENTLIIHSGEIARQYVQEFSKRYKESGGIGAIVSVKELISNFPGQFALSQNYPNPFNPTTTFQFQIPITGLVTIKVFDILGREVASLLNEIKPVGAYQITWNASTLPSGVYFYQVQNGANTIVKKALLLK